MGVHLSNLSERDLINALPCESVLALKCGLSYANHHLRAAGFSCSRERSPTSEYQQQHGRIYSCGNVACRMCRERNSNTVIRIRPLHTMPTVGKTPRCSRLSPSAEEPMVRQLHKIRRETPLTRPCRASGTTAKR